MGPHHEADGSLLINVDGHVGALDPRVGAEVAQPHVRVPADSMVPWSAAPAQTFWHPPLPPAPSKAPLVTKPPTVDESSLLYFHPSMLAHAHVPRDEGVRLLQRGGVQLKEGGDVIAVGHGHQPVLDLLPRVPAAGAAAAPLHQGKWL